MAVPQLVEMLEAHEVPEKSSKRSKKDEKKFLLVAQELKIARHLAGNDKTLRHRAVKSLKKWFHHRSQNLPFTENDFLMLWKGLFYSMWMSDTPLVQEECAEEIASLLHELPLPHSLLLFKCGLITLTNEWFGIDQLRLDKFMMFTRRILRQALYVLKKNGFKKDDIATFGEILNFTVLEHRKKDALGLFMHFTEIFLEELSKVCEGNLKPELVTSFLIPFTKCLASAEDIRKVNQIKKFVFIHLMKQSDAGLEYQEKYNAWKKEGFPGTIHAMQKCEIESNGEVDEIDVTRVNEAQSSSNKPLDPRAGRVDVELPQIKFHPKAIADMLLNHKYTEGSTVAARNTISLLAKQFRKLAHGTYPLGLRKLRLPKSEVKDMKIKKAVNRLVKFEKKLMGEDRRSKKRKNEEEKDSITKRQKLENGMKHMDNDNNSTKKDQFKQKLKNFIDTSEEHVHSKLNTREVLSKRPVSSTSRKNEKVQKRKTSVTEVNMFKVETPLKKKAKVWDKVKGEPANTFERNSGLWHVFNQDDSNVSDCSQNNSSSELGTFIENKITRLSDKSLSTNKETNSPENITKVDISPKKVKKSSCNGLSPKESPKTGLSALVSSTPTKELFPKNPWEEPLEEGEYELCIQSRAYTDKIKKLSRKSTENVQALINNSLRRSQRYSTPQVGKRVKINTNLNQSQEFHEYHSQILSSPVITFDASKKPGKPLLKTPTLSSPLNPFYKQLDYC